MLRRSVQLEIPRQVVVYYLLFCMVAIVWLTLGVVHISKSVLNTHSESEFLAFLSRAGTAASLECLKSEGGDLRTLLERFKREWSLVSCAVVGPDGVIIAHTRRGHVGERYEVPTGDHFDWGELEAVRYSRGGRSVREYSVSLDVAGDEFGKLRMTREEPTLWSTIRLTARHAPTMLFGPLVLVAIGAGVLHRVVRPMSEVESQLRDAALAPTVADVEIHTVRASTAGAIGWNRLVENFVHSKDSGGLQERLTEAVQSLQRERSDDVLNSLSDGVAVTDRDGRITFSNHAMGALFARDARAESLIGRPVEDCFNVETSQGSALSDPGLCGRHVIEEIKRRVGNVEQILRVARSPICSSDRTAGHVWSVRDVTQQKLAEAMRNQFLDSATHELRTPLANIKAYAETLALSDMLDLESQRQFCNTINTEATRLARFIDDLLSISSMEVGALSLDRQAVDVERLVTEVLDKVKPQMDAKQIVFTSIFPEKYPSLRLDKDKVNVALVNLLGNAAKYTPEGGRVAFRVKVTETEMHMEIEDSGIGIAADELPKIFDKFFRSSNAAVQVETGTGLGLSMACEVIRLHGGDLTVRSELGSGSTFTASFPLS